MEQSQIIVPKKSLDAYKKTVESAKLKSIKEKDPEFSQLIEEKKAQAEVPRDTLADDLGTLSLKTHEDQQK